MRRPFINDARYADQTARNAHQVAVRPARQLQGDGTSVPGVGIFTDQRLLLMLDQATAQRIAQEISACALENIMPTEWRTK